MVEIKKNELIAVWRGADELMYKLALIPRDAIDEDSDEGDALYLIGLDSGNVRRFEEVLDTAYERFTHTQRARVAWVLNENGEVPSEAREALAPLLMASV